MCRHSCFYCSVGRTVRNLFWALCVCVCLCTCVCMHSHMCAAVGVVIVRTHAGESGWPCIFPLLLFHYGRKPGQRDCPSWRGLHSSCLQMAFLSLKCAVFFFPLMAVPVDVTQCIFQVIVVFRRSPISVVPPRPLHYAAYGWPSCQ